MRKTSFKLLSASLAVAMTMSSMPYNVLAASPEQTFLLQTCNKQWYFLPVFFNNPFDFLLSQFVAQVQQKSLIDKFYCLK